jgi:hypothetical protein
VTFAGSEYGVRGKSRQTASTEQDLKTSVGFFATFHLKKIASFGWYVLNFDCIYMPKLKAKKKNTQHREIYMLFIKK